MAAGTLHLLNYADDRLGHKGGAFAAAQQALNESARAHGIRHIVSWRWPDLAATSLYATHREYLERPYRLNGFVFKPYITLRLLEQVDAGDVVVYYDSGDGGHLINCSLDPLIELCGGNAGTVFAQWGDSNARWTKRDCFALMGCDEPRFHNAVALQATWFVVQKTDFTMSLVAQWLRHTLDERIASYENRRVCGLPDLAGFEEHRGDQSVLSLLAVKHGLTTFYGAGGPANRRIGAFVRALSGAGWWRAQALRRLGQGRVAALRVRSGLARSYGALLGRR